MLCHPCPYVYQKVHAFSPFIGVNAIYNRYSCYIVLNSCTVSDLVVYEYHHCKHLQIVGCLV